MDALPRKPVKAQPKQVKAATATTRGATTTTRGRGTKRGRNAGRSKPKTAEELDAEMTDYFVGGTNSTGAVDGAVTNGAVVPAAAGGDDMGVDEISVRADAARTI